MTSALLGAAASLSLACTHVSVSPFLGHWQRSGVPSETVDIEQHEGRIVVRMEPRDKQNSAMEALITVDGKLVVPVARNLSAVLIVDPVKGVLSSGDYVYVRAKSGS